MSEELLTGKRPLILRGYHDSDAVLEVSVEQRTIPQIFKVPTSCLPHRPLQINSIIGYNFPEGLRGYEIKITEGRITKFSVEENIWYQS